MISQGAPKYVVIHLDMDLENRILLVTGAQEVFVISKDNLRTNSTD